MYDAIVVGGGVVGMSTAYHLVAGGARTLLLDRADPGRATDAGAGILSPETNSRDPESWFTFAVEAVAYYPSLIQQLETDQGGDTGYAQCGQMIVAVSDDEREAFERAKQVIFSRQARRGQPSLDDLAEVSTSVAHRLFPPLAPVFGAIYYRRAARVDGRLLNRALSGAAEGRGLVRRQSAVERLILRERRVTGVVVAGETLEAGHVVVAGGAWSQDFAAQLGVDIPVAPQRGQIIHLRLPNTDTSAWPMISAFHGHYMVPWSDHRVVVGATRETDSGFQPMTTAAGVCEVLSEALRVAPGLATAEVRDVRVGLRPYSADTLPILGSVPGIDGIYLATGHGPTGLTLGPFSGKVIADLVLDQRPTIDITAFSLNRFAARATTESPIRQT